MKKRYVIEYRHKETGYHRISFSNKMKFFRQLLRLTRASRDDVILIGWTDVEIGSDDNWMLMDVKGVQAIRFDKLDDADHDDDVIVVEK